ncbi:MAG: hypothetical protein QM727_07125 [Niabella sp.]
MRTKSLLLFALISGSFACVQAQSLSYEKDMVNLKRPSVHTLLQSEPSKANLPVFYTQANQAAMRVVRDETYWRKFRTKGIVLTGVGVACIAGGIALAASGSDDYYDGYSHHYQDDSDDSRTAFGVLGIAGGITAVGGGITMWAIGNNRLRKFSSRAKIDFGPRSAHLVYKF